MGRTIVLDGGSIDENSEDEEMTTDLANIREGMWVVEETKITDRKKAPGLKTKVSMLALLAWRNSLLDKDFVSFQGAVADISPARCRVIKLPFNLRGRVDTQGGRVNGTQRICFPAHEAWKHHLAQAQCFAGRGGSAVMNRGR